MLSLGASLHVDAASPRTISIDKKKISSGTQGNRGFDMRGMVTKFVLVWLFSTSSGVFAIFTDNSSLTTE